MTLASSGSITPIASWSSTLSRADRVLGQVHHGRRRLGEPVLRVGRIVVVRRDHPLLVLEHHAEPRRRGRRRLELDHFQVGASQRVLEVLEEGLSLVVEIRRWSWSGRACSTKAAPVSTRATATKVKVLYSSFIGRLSVVSCQSSSRQRQCRVSCRLPTSCMRWRESAERSATLARARSLVTATDDGSKPAASGSRRGSRGAVGRSRRPGPGSAAAAEGSRRPRTGPCSGCRGSSAPIRPCPRGSRQLLVLDDLLLDVEPALGDRLEVGELDLLGPLVPLGAVLHGVDLLVEGLLGLEQLVAGLVLGLLGLLGELLVKRFRPVARARRAVRCMGRFFAG